ncbi:type II toxin-antitoxin system death-on-curing family toxin [Paenibacillus sp. MMO-58]|uniref:type II toxin-antitoxin system death-on-curing family toxin n=1 Tax=Paenibacillus sp. MMO-58 TaxID=3081290 RepID=UPI0030158B94
MYVQLTAEQIIQIHDEQLKVYGGLPGIKDRGRLDFIAEQPFMESFSQELYPGLFRKASVYFYTLATAHAFNDANKRTAVLTCYVFLTIHNQELIANDDELYEVAIKVATKTMNIDELSIWLQNNCE